MRAMVSFLELEPEEEEEESEDLEQPLRKNERIKQERTEITERGQAKLRGSSKRTPKPLKRLLPTPEAQTPR
jgi:hypothetical protein